MKQKITGNEYLDNVRWAIFSEVGDYLIYKTKVMLRHLDYPKKNRGGQKFGYVVTCVAKNQKDGEQDCFCKRIKNYKDACKFYQFLHNYCNSYGQDGLMKVWEKVEECFDDEITFNKDYCISLYTITEHHRWHREQFCQLS